MLIMWFLLKLMIVSESPWKNHAYSFTIDIAANKSFIIPFGEKVCNDMVCCAIRLDGTAMRVPRKHVPLLNWPISVS